MATLSQALCRYWQWPSRCLEDGERMAIPPWENLLVPGTTIQGGHMRYLEYFTGT